MGTPVFTTDSAVALYNVCVKRVAAGKRGRDDDANMEKSIDTASRILDKLALGPRASILLIVGCDTEDVIIDELALFARVLGGTGHVRVVVAGTAASAKSASAFLALEREKASNVICRPALLNSVREFFFVVNADRDAALRAHALVYQCFSSPVLAMNTTWWKLSGQTLSAVKPRSNGGWTLAHAWLDDGEAEDQTGVLKPTGTAKPAPKPASKPASKAAPKPASKPASTPAPKPASTSVVEKAKVKAGAKARPLPKCTPMPAKTAARQHSDHRHRPLRDPAAR